MNRLKQALPHHTQQRLFSLLSHKSLSANHSSSDAFVALYSLLSSFSLSSSYPGLPSRANMFFL